MQTLLDPFEVVSPLPARTTLVGLSIRSAAGLRVESFLAIEGDPFAVAPVSAPAASDSWSRLRCWCSED